MRSVRRPSPCEERSTCLYCADPGFRPWSSLKKNLPKITNRQNQGEEEFSFGTLTLIGHATDYLLYFIYALDELGEIIE